jgi:hypothetical protein
MTQAPFISAFAAVQIKPQLTAVTEAVRRDAAGLPEDRALPVIQQIVDEARAHVQHRKSAQRAGEPRQALEMSVKRLWDALEALSEMPPAQALVAALPEDTTAGLVVVERAVMWLSELADAWSNRQQGIGLVQQASGSLTVASKSSVRISAHRLVADRRQGSMSGR